MLQKIKRIFVYFINPAKHWFLKLFKLLPQIEWVVFEVTDACNSRCKHCNIWQQKPAQNILTVDEIRKIFSDPLLKNLKAVLITGGEPVLRQDIIELFDAIHGVLPGARITLSTNGLLPERVIDVVSFSIKSKIPFDVGISLDAIGDKNDEIRGVKGNFKKVDFLVNKLVEIRGKTGYDFNIIVGHTLSPITIGTLDEVKAYSEANGVIFLTQLYDEGSFYHNIGEINFSGKKSALAEEINKVKPSFHKEFLKEVLKKRIIRFQCFALKTFFLLRANGEVAPCLQLSHLSAGNLKKDSFSKIWLGQKAKEIRESVKKCQGCANSWAINWSMKSNFLPFVSLITRSFFNSILKK